jgi:hypothetical protein
MFRATLILLTASLLLGADKPGEDAVKKEAAAFEGKWKIVSPEAEGMQLQAETFKDILLTIKGNAWTMK